MLELYCIVIVIDINPHVTFIFLSLSLFSLASKMKNEKRRERTVSRSIALSPKARFVSCFFILGMVPKRLMSQFFFKCFPLSYFERSTHQTFLEARRRRRRRRRREEEERRYQEEDFSLGKKNKRLDLNFFLSLFFTSRSLLRSFFFRERERKREFSFYALTTL